MNESRASDKALKLLGVDPNNLGCVMLDVDLPPEYREVMDPDWGYTSPDRDYIAGFTGEAHITLLYGLLFSAKEHKGLVDEVLDGWWKPPVLVLPQVKVFPQEENGVKYAALVLGTKEKTVWGFSASEVDLVDANRRLSRLPHVRMYYEYTPHVTIGYVKEEYITEAKLALSSCLNRPIKTGDINYGD